MKRIIVSFFTTALFSMSVNGQHLSGTSLTVSGHSELASLHTWDLSLFGDIKVGTTDLLGSNGTDMIYGVPTFQILVDSTPSSWGDYDYVQAAYLANYGSGVMEFRSTHSDATFLWRAPDNETNPTTYNTLMSLNNYVLTVNSINTNTLNASNLTIGGSPLPSFTNYIPSTAAPNRLVWGAAATGSSNNAISIGAGSKSGEGVSIGQNALSGPVAGTDSSLNLYEKASWEGGIRGVAIGESAFAGAYSTAVGYGAAARLDGLAAGRNSQAFGQSALALGREVESIGDNTVTLGLGLKAIDKGMVVVGSFNADVNPGGTTAERALTTQSAAAAFVVGVGASDSQRFNGFVVRRSGKVEVSGELSVNGETTVGNVEVQGTLIIASPAGGVSVAEEFGGPPSGN